MISLNELKTLHTQQNTQFLLINKKGIIIESDNVLFDCKKGVSLDSIHPFFINLTVNTNQADMKFSCVHLDIDESELICDIIIKKQDDDLLLLIITDFSHHYNSFQSLAQSRNETAISSEILEIDNYILSKKEEFKNTFISNFNHELVSPILSILTFTDFLSKTTLSSSQKDYLEIISSSAVTLKSMVNDIFDISKIETGNLEITNKRFSLKRLTKVIKSEYKHRCKAKNINLKIIYHENMPNYIVSDKLRLTQIITNLIDNAIKYTEIGSITLSIEAIYRRARNLTYTIKVIDTGVGIASSNYDFIFGRFNRLETSKLIPGNGLGLSICKDIVTAMQGEISVKSELNTGSIFTVTLRTTTPLKSPSEQKPTFKITDKNAPKRELLLVEDSYSDQLSIFKILAATKNYYIDIATSGDEAIKLSDKKPYDLILMDYKLKSLDGFETSKRINKNSRKNIPILIITGKKFEASLIKHYEPYFKSILHKPFDPETLIDYVTMHIN